MIQQPQPSFPPEVDDAGKSRLPFWAVALFCLALSCVVASIAGALLLSHFSLSFNSALPTQAPLPPAPTTPAIFGLSGQASCRHFSPPTTSPWLSVARDDATKYQLDSLAFQWQIWQESKYNPDARSADNAIGIAQFLPETAADLGIDPTNPEQSLDAAARLDRARLSQYAQRGADLAEHYGGASARYAYGLVLAAYNAGGGAVETAWSRAFTDNGEQVWPKDAWAWLALMPNQTRNYVPAILGCL
ncbi:MAG TPA: lytic transglycosylase domain-containing protein [Ktedonobacterales bacterium]|nr:lytic transglycosylase domain-containing protein [Ktedonobacterales bacterium]